ncbi:hypothetical protein E2C01_030233 [Portunus trituberculatus]|uniref:Uncharacterized protein n=1 Tax=Portunus trituberculatus TaxID=210409 RepID=A0A5B7ETQ3_PORTR|nr:hypothetical protein [Portunus trituberculatus]
MKMVAEEEEEEDENEEETVKGSRKVKSLGAKYDWTLSGSRNESLHIVRRDFLRIAGVNEAADWTGTAVRV